MINNFCLLSLRHTSACKLLMALLFIMLVFFVPAKGQKIKDSSATPFKKNIVGFLIGTNISTIRDWNPSPSYNTANMLGPSFKFAFIYQRNILPQLSIRSGLGYVRKGATYQYFTGYNDQVVDVKVVLNYVEAPVLVVLQSTNERDYVLKPYLCVGMAYALAMGSSMGKGDIVINNPVVFNKDINNDIYNRIENSIMVGTGLKFRGEHSDFFIEIMYSCGTTDVFRYTSRNSVVSLQAGFLFGK